METAPIPPRHSSVHTDPALADFAKWLGQRGMNDLAQAARDTGSASALGLDLELPGPVGERNLYALHPRGNILLVPQTETGLYRQMMAALATGNTVYIDEASELRNVLKDIPASVAVRTVWTKTGKSTHRLPVRWWKGALNAS